MEFEKISELLLTMEVDSKCGTTGSDEFNLAYTKFINGIRGAYDIFAMSDGGPTAFETIIRQCLTSLLDSDRKAISSDICYVIEKNTGKIVAAARTERHMDGINGTDILVVYAYLPRVTGGTPEVEAEQKSAAEALYEGVSHNYYYTTMSWRLSVIDEKYFAGIKELFPKGKQVIFS